MKLQIEKTKDTFAYSRATSIIFSYENGLGCKLLLGKKKDKFNLTHIRSYKSMNRDREYVRYVLSVCHLISHLKEE